MLYSGQKQTVCLLRSKIDLLRHMRRHIYVCICIILAGCNRHNLGVRLQSSVRQQPLSGIASSREVEQVSTVSMDSYRHAIIYTRLTHILSLPALTDIRQERFPVSKITAAALEDLGYVVDPSKVTYRAGPSLGTRAAGKMFKSVSQLRCGGGSQTSVRVKSQGLFAYIGPL